MGKFTCESLFAIGNIFHKFWFDAATPYGPTGFFATLIVIRGVHGSHWIMFDKTHYSI